MIVLTEEEKVKFARYCIEQAEGYKKLADQMEALIGGGTVMSKPVKAKSVAFSLVATHLGSGEQETISG